MRNLLRPEIKFLLCASRADLEEINLLELKKLPVLFLDWQKILKLAKSHSVGALIYNTVRKYDFLKNAAPQKIISELKQQYYLTLSRNLLLWNKFLNIYRAFKNYDIDIIPLKGIILWKIAYNNPALRLISADIDILVKQKDAERASVALEKTGYAKSGACYHHAVFTKKNNLPVELHWYIMPWQNTIKTENLWERSVIEIIDNNPIRVLSYEDQILTLPIQTRYEMQSISLFRLCDSNEILARQKNMLDWSYIIKAAEDYKIRGPLLFNLCLCRYFLSSPVPENVIQELTACSLKRKLLFVILKHGPYFIFDKELRVKNARLRLWLLKFLSTDRLLICIQTLAYNFKKLPCLRTLYAHPAKTPANIQKR